MTFYENQPSIIKNIIIKFDKTPIIVGDIELSHADLYVIEHSDFVKIHDGLINIYRKDGLTFWIPSHLVNENGMYDSTFRFMALEKDNNKI